jgi:hypothetical protein
MKSSRQIIVPGILAFALFFVPSTRLDSQEKKDVVGGVRGAIIGTQTATFDKDFLLEPLKIVQFKIESLLIKPAETVSVPETMEFETEFGQTLKYCFSWPSGPKGGISLELTPFLVKAKGIDLKIMVFHRDQKVKEETLRLENFEPIVVEVLKDQETKVKLAHRITPLIKEVFPLRNYPETIRKFELISHILIMNDQLLVNNARGGGLWDDNVSQSDPSFLFFSVKGKGIYILSFWPFDGAEPLGFVTSNVINIRHGKDFFALYSIKPILPDGKWRVWVRHNPSFEFPSDMAQNIPSGDRPKTEAAALGVIRGRGVLNKFFKKLP